MGKRPGAKYAAVQRLNALMADGEKRGVAKAEARARGESLFDSVGQWPKQPEQRNEIYAFEKT